MNIKTDNLIHTEVIGLIKQHLSEMAATSPPESTHALGIEKLKAPDVTFWSAWIDGDLAGCVAIKEINSKHAEIKSMRTADAFLRKGVAAKLLEHVIREAGERGYKRLSLETGSMAYFAPARALYSRYGFNECLPFEGYEEDPNSVFMTKAL
ncbi:GNAT family N-acetyltransferase [Shouchella patagoniensis]|uniref:GNAT family N-acetyltransferase n=1 Tax=Shouchella patagoniensis TaxID=228576 RepID=UPI0009959BE5|nr:GNAT family N-acetyltransferase [Shouchella patagoniensis]